MYITELFAVNHVTGVILNDQREFFGGRIFELNAEYNVVIVGSNILNGYLLVGQALFIATAIGQAGQRIAHKEYNSHYCYRKGFYYTGVERINVHLIFIL